MPVSYELIRSDRKSISLQIMPDGRLVVRCPKSMPDRQVQEFVESKQSWIEAHRPKAPAQPAFTQAQLEALAQQALTVIPKRVAHFAPLVGVRYGRITIRNQHSRWGSCSAKGNLNFNCLLMLVPPEVLDYVVVHELCHRKEMNHSPKFWAEVERVMPDWKARRDWLKTNGNDLIARL